MSSTLTARETRILRPQQHTEASLVPALVVERRRMLEARLKAVQADTTPIRTSTRTEAPHYSGLELAEPAVRSGADNHMGLPSRRGDWLYYRDNTRRHIDPHYQEATS